jgi:uncharacterized membrane protein YraQ (UPF0718 family)
VENNVRDFVVIFLSIIYEAFPFIVLGVVIAGILEEFVPQELIPRLIPRNRPLAIAISCFLGLPFPMCECGIIPVMRRLLRKGLPLSCCVAYMLAGPIINFVVMLATAVAFRGMETAETGTGRLAHQMGGAWMMSMRMILGFLVAFGTGLVVEWQYRRHGIKLLSPRAQPDIKGTPATSDNGLAITTRKSVFQRLSSISETALHDFVDIMAFLVLGALLAALTRQVLSHDDVDQMSRNYPVFAILIMMGLAIVLCLCSEADAFVAASFTTLQPAAKLAFLVLGPMLDFKLYMMYTRVFSTRLIWTIITCVVVQVFAYSLLTHYAWESGALEGAVTFVQHLVTGHVSARS